MSFESGFSPEFWQKRLEIEKKESIKQKSKERQGGVIEREKLLEKLIFEEGMSAEEAKKEADKRLGGGETIKIDKYLEEQ